MYKSILKSYLNNINTLRSFVSSVELSLSKKKDEIVERNTERLMPMLFALNQVDPDKYKLSDAQLSKLMNIFEDKVEVKKEGEDTTDRFSITLKGEAGTHFSKAMKEISLHKGQIDMLYQNSLISLIVFFELLISRVLHTHITIFPGVMSIKDKTLSLEEIRKLGTFNDAEQYLIDQEVESIMYGSLEKWYKYLTDKIKISVPYFDKNKGKITEIFQRRNLVVHNDGVINSIYFKNVDRELRKNLEIGEKIEINREYINEAVSLIENAGVLILLEMWKKAEKKSQDRVIEIMNEGYTLMLESNWGLAANLYEFASNEQGITAEERLMSKVNYWQCMKWNGQFESIKKEVDEADFTPYNRKFQLSLLALKKEKDNFFELLEISMPHDITFEELKEWPLFTEIRETEEYKNLIKKIEEPTVKVEFSESEVTDFAKNNIREKHEQLLVNTDKEYNELNEEKNEITENIN